MQKIVWLGPRDGARDVRPRLGEVGIALSTHESALGALATLAQAPAGIVLVDAEWQGAAAALAAILEARPELEPIAVTRADLPSGLAAVLRAGASRVVHVADPSQRGAATIVAAALERGEARREEADLLAQIGALTDQLLRDLVTLERRNIELERQLEPTEPDAGPERALTVLVADDEEGMRRSLQKALTQAGFSVETAEHGEAALDRVRGGDLDVLIVDKNMPRMSGLEVLRASKRLRPEVAVILITGYASQESAIEALHAGADAYLLKPFGDIKEVVDKINDVQRSRMRTTRTQRYLNTIKERKGELLARYRELRSELERRFRERTGRS